MRRVIVASVSAAFLCTGLLFAPPALAAGGGHGYDSVPKHLPGNLLSLGFEATSTSEFGNQVTFAAADHPMQLHDVVVTMSSWACQQGAWDAGNCATKGGAEFSWPITFNVYNPPAPNSSTPGSLIATDTQVFKIPYRPSASPKCTGDQAGEWYSDSSKSCFNGLATNITFHFDDSDVSLPSSVVYGVAYNTSTAGYAPVGIQPCHATPQGCPYDSLNVGMSNDPTDVSAGSDPNPGTVFWNTSYAPNYCDSGAHGVSMFRLDSPNDGCWSNGAPNTLPAIVPAVWFK